MLPFLLAAAAVLTLTATDLKVGDFSNREDFLFEMDQGEHQATWTPLSQVGTLVSYAEDMGGYTPGAAHPWAVRRYTARDARNDLVMARLDAVFPRQAVRAALMGDALVKDALGARRPANLDSLVRTLSGYQSIDCEYGFGEDLLTRFAFHHVEGDRVAVRIGLSHGCEVARGKLTVLGVWLPIPRARAADFEAARTGRRGFLMVNAPKKKAVTTFKAK